MNKIDGWRKMGIAMGTIGGLIYKSPADFRVTIVIGVIAVVGILCQTWLDNRKKNEPNV